VVVILVVVVEVVDVTNRKAVAVVDAAVVASDIAEAVAVAVVRGLQVEPWLLLLTWKQLPTLWSLLIERRDFVQESAEETECS